MKSFLKEYFYISEDGKIREKVLLTRIGISVGMILLCLAAMAFSAYGFFAHDQQAPTSVIRAANFDLNITAPDDVLPPAADVYTLVNNTDAPKVFVFTLTRQETPTAASVGYCKIKIKTDVNGADYDDTQVFFTKPIGLFLENGQETNLQSRQVTITVAAHSDAKVTFIANLGSCASQEVVDTAIVPLFSTPIATASEQETESQPDITDSIVEPTDPPTEPGNGTDGIEGEGEQGDSKTEPTPKDEGDIDSEQESAGEADNNGVTE